jgi:hypothetical protein
VIGSKSLRSGTGLPHPAARRTRQQQVYRSHPNVHKTVRIQSETKGLQTKSAPARRSCFGGGNRVIEQWRLAGKEAFCQKGLVYPDGDKWKGRYREERETRMRRTRPGCSWSTELAIVVSRRSRREISLQKAGDRLKERKAKRKAGGNCGRQIRAPRMTAMPWKNECLRDHV